MQAKHNWVVPKQPAVMVPQRKNINYLGTSTQQVQELDRKATEQEVLIEANARSTWKKQEDKGFGNVHSKMQQAYAPALVKGLKIMYYSSVDMDEKGDEKELVWMSGVVERVSDGTWMVSANTTTKCHKAGEAAEIKWDPNPSINFPGGRSIEKLNPKLWNKAKEGAWCKDLGEIDYGI